MLVLASQGTFPDPDPNDVYKSRIWQTTPLWPGNEPSSNLSYKQQADSVKTYLRDDLDIHVTKVTHAFRVTGARVMDEAGVNDHTIMRMGHWLHQALYNSYLMFFKADGLLSLGGWPEAANKNFKMFWHERFYPDIPKS